MEPINYTANFKNPMDAFKESFNTGSTMLATQQTQALNETMIKRQTDITALLNKLQQPGATAQDYLKASMFLDKDSAEAMRKGVESMQIEQRQAALTDTAQIFSAFKAGRTDLAVQLIRRQAEAERNSGNEQGAALAEEWAKMAESGPDGAKAVEMMLGFTIASLPGGDKAIEGVTAFEKSLQDAKLFPILTAQKQAELAKATSDAERAAIDAKYAEPIAQATEAKSRAEAAKLQIELQTYPALKAQELAKATSDAEKAAIDAKYADRTAAATTRLVELGVDFKSVELKTLADLKTVELSKAKSEAEKAAVDAKYADPIAAAQLLLTQGNAQAQQISLKTLEEAKALELSAAKTADEVAKVNAKYAEPMAAAQLLEAQGVATATGITSKTLAELKAAELAKAKSDAEVAAINAKYADPLQAAQLLLAQGQAKAIEITNLSLADLKAQELAKAKSDAEVAAVNAKYADPQQAANLLLTQNKNSELAVVLQTLAEEKKQALAKATSDAQKAAIEASFAQRVNQADLDQRLATLDLTMEQIDRSKIEKAIAQAKEARAVETFPDEKARLTAQALIAQSEATIAEVNAKYAEKLKIAELEKMGKDNELSDAQINRAIAEGKKVSADTAKTLMEIEALKKTGGVPADKLFDYEDRIRKEYVARTAKVASMQQTYETIKASSVDDTGAGDVALIFGFMRMLDPDSVVRESEFATAQDTAGLVNKLRALGTKVESGQFLSKQQREEFAALAKKYMDAALNHEKRVREDLNITVKNYGLNPANVFGVGSPNTPPAQTEPEPTVEVDF